MSATSGWDALEPVRRLAFDEAGTSYGSGNYGVGAVLSEPDGVVVAVGRNRVAEVQGAPRTLSGNMTAHAEMNAFASMDRFDATGLRLTTTLEPCLMCAATAMQLKIAHVDFAADDEFYAGMTDLWAHHPVTAQRTPTTTGPYDGDDRPFGVFARLLPLTFTLANFPARSAAQLARARRPALTGLVDRLRDDADWRRIVDGGTCRDAVAHLWSELVEVHRSDSTGGKDTNGA